MPLPRIRGASLVCIADALRAYAVNLATGIPSGANTVAPDSAIAKHSLLTVEILRDQKVKVRDATSQPRHGELFGHELTPRKTGNNLILTGD